MTYKHLLTGIREEFEAGIPPKLIAEKHGVCAHWVRVWLNRIKPGSVRDRLSNRNNDIAMRLNRGDEIKRIAADYKLSYGSIWNIARKYGVTRVTVRKRQRARVWEKRYVAGESLASIARSYGIPKSTVRSAVERLRKAGMR